LWTTQKKKARVNNNGKQHGGEPPKTTGRGKKPVPKLVGGLWGGGGGGGQPPEKKRPATNPGPKPPPTGPPQKKNPAGLGKTGGGKTPFHLPRKKMVFFFTNGKTGGYPRHSNPAPTATQGPKPYQKPRVSPVQAGGGCPQKNPRGKKKHKREKKTGNGRKEKKKNRGVKLQQTPKKKKKKTQKTRANLGGGRLKTQAHEKRPGRPMGGKKLWGAPAKTKTKNARNPVLVFFTHPQNQHCFPNKRARGKNQKMWGKGGFFVEPNATGKSPNLTPKDNLPPQGWGKKKTKKQKKQQQKGKEGKEKNEGWLPSICSNKNQTPKKKKTVPNPKQTVKRKKKHRHNKHPQSKKRVCLWGFHGEKKTVKKHHPPRATNKNFLGGPKRQPKEPLG